MTDEPTTNGTGNDAGPNLASENAALRARLVQAELRTEALRAGMVDLDGVRLIDPGAIQLTEAGGLEGGSALMTRLRQDKPWLFGRGSSSSGAAAPTAAPAAPRSAMDMGVDEWRAARAELLRRRG
ncbi:MAG TPA: hypothetical protein VGC15_19755 [Acetobacteraceae bacterium]